MLAKPWLRAALALLCCCFGVAALAGDAGYYRWPVQHGDVLVFASQGDLWRAPRDGGPAIRLTTHPELESRPAISPDGNWLAFNAHYDGAREVYVMPLAGGAPKQLTFEGGGTGLRGWTPDGKVLYVTANLPSPWARSLRTVDIDSLEVATLPLAGAADASFSDDGRVLFFTRFGLGLSNDNAILYRGGRMAQLWRFTPAEAREAERLATEFGAPIRHPMWWRGRVYFISDKSGADNIWSLDATGEDIQQHSRFTGWQLRHPRLADGEIVYQRGADLYRFDLASNSERMLPLSLVSDHDQARRRWLDKPLDFLESSLMGASGDAVTLTARGRAAVTFPGKRRRVELAVPSSARARAAVNGAGDAWVYAILDQDPIGEIWRFPADGSGLPEQLTRQSDAHIWRLLPSPDGRSLVFDDTRRRLWSLDLSSNEKTLIDTADSSRDRAFGGFAWSPDGRYLAYHKRDVRSMTRIVIRDLETGRSETATGGKYMSFGPAFSADGKWLYFISSRNFVATPSSPWGDRNMGPAFLKRGKLYALQLDPQAPFAFVEADELAAGTPAASEATGDKSADAAADNPTEATVHFDGLAGRLWEVPVEPGNYWALRANKKFLYVLDREGRHSDLKSIAIGTDKAKPQVFAKQVRYFALSADGETLFYRTSTKNRKVGVMALVPAAAQAPKKLEKYKLRIGDWRLGIDPRSEWRQLLLDAWRLHRDFAFDAKLRDVDWDAVRDKYLPFADRIGHRSELDDLMAQMVAELGILHSQIRPGDLPKDAQKGVSAFLGATFETARDGLEISQIYDGERELPHRLGPLLKPGVDVRPGDVLTAVDGRPVNSQRELAAALQHKAGQQIRLDLRRADAAHSEIVVPVAAKDARRLRYAHWVEENRRRVARAGAGRIGYLHLRAMQRADIASFARDFYEHYDKDALIVDVRGNRGGNIDSWLIATLLRRVWAFWQARNGGPAYGNMQQTFRGHLAVLVDEGTYSDGETFSAGIKALGLAPLIGTQTAGAGIWLRDRNRLADRGMARVAEFPQFGLDGRWLLEGRGVSPDIPVVNPPHATFLGADAQLDAAIGHLKDKLQAEPIPPLRGRPIPGVGTAGQDVR